MNIQANPRRPLVLLLFLLAATALIASGCGDDDDPTDPNGGGNGNITYDISSEMQGVWSFTQTFTDCDGNPITHPAFQDEAYLDTLCIESGTIDDLVDDPSCTITGNNSNSFTMTCNYNESIPGVDCNVAGNTSITYTWTSTTMSATGTIDITATGSECSQYSQADVCALMTITATRTGDAPAGACGSMSSRFDVAGKIMDRLRR